MLLWDHILWIRLMMADKAYGMEQSSFWVVILSVVCFHDQRWLLCLHDCLPGSAWHHWHWAVSRLGEWAPCEWKDGLIRAQSTPLPGILCPLCLGDWSYWLHIVHPSLKNHLVKEVRNVDGDISDLFRHLWTASCYRLLGCELMMTSCHEEPDQLDLH